MLPHSAGALGNAGGLGIFSGCAPPHIDRLFSVLTTQTEVGILLSMNNANTNTAPATSSELDAAIIAFLTERAENDPYSILDDLGLEWVIFETQPKRGNDANHRAIVRAINRLEDAELITCNRYGYALI